MSENNSDLNSIAFYKVISWVLIIAAGTSALNNYDRQLNDIVLPLFLLIFAIMLDIRLIIYTKEKHAQNPASNPASPILIPILIVKILLVLVPLSILYLPVATKTNVSDSNVVTNRTQQKPAPFKSSDYDSITKNEPEILPITINPTSSYNNLTKKQLYALRKKHVQSSIFAHKNYQPKEEVFGGIEDQKPWYGINSSICFDKGLNIKRKTYGDSSMSKFINNPSMLIGIMLPYSFDYSSSVPICTQQSLKFIPASMSFDKKNNRIVSVYKISEFVLHYKLKDTSDLYYTLITTNARDMGFNYGYIYYYSGIKMTEQSNTMADKVSPLVNYFHLGQSCGVDGGCNNVSPRTTNAEFEIKTLPSQIDLKLWKSYPATIDSNGDINYRIIFEES